MLPMNMHERFAAASAVLLHPIAPSSARLIKPGPLQSVRRTATIPSARFAVWPNSQRPLLALTVSPRRTIPSAAQGMSGPCADIPNPSKMTRSSPLLDAGSQCNNRCTAEIPGAMNIIDISEGLVAETPDGTGKKASLVYGIVKRVGDFKHWQSPIPP